VSLNRSNVRTQGTLQGSASSTTFNTLPPNVTSASASASATVFNNLESKWTISEMARLGYLVTPDLLVYGLFGWSWGGFEWNDGVTPFTMNGPTWGAGVERISGGYVRLCNTKASAISTTMSISRAQAPTKRVIFKEGGWRQHSLQMSTTRDPADFLRTTIR
jgi:hypothetical protein